MRRVIVVGAGAAGIFAARRAAEMGASVTLLEKTERIGTKILISGGGKCNVAHAGPVEDVIRAFRRNEAAFIRPACHRMPNTAIMELMADGGLEMITRPDGRVFPEWQTAKDVVAILRRGLDEAGVTVRLKAPVAGLVVRDSRVAGVRLAPRSDRPYREGLVDGEGEVLEADAVVLATGGSSYPNTGTTGDGWPWAREVGHTVVKVRPALAPAYMELAVPAVSGVAFRDVMLRARQAGKVAAEWRGDLLMTHQGVSGPTVLGITRVVAERMAEGPVSLEIDLRPERPADELSAEWLRVAAEAPRRPVESVIPEVAERLRHLVFAAAGVEPATPFSRLAKRDRNRLAETVKRFPLGPVRTVPLEKGECVAGGVALEEVDPRTMASRKIQGLWLCGEMLDIAGPVGGYNLQAAFATGYVAGEFAASG